MANLVSFHSGSLVSQDTHSSIRGIPFSTSDQIPYIPEGILNQLQLPIRAPEAFYTLKERASAIQGALDEYSTLKHMPEWTQNAKTVTYCALSILGLGAAILYSSILIPIATTLIALTIFAHSRDIQAKQEATKQYLDLFVRDVKQLVSYMRLHGKELDKAMKRCTEAAVGYALAERIKTPKGQRVQNTHKEGMRILELVKAEIAKANACTRTYQQRGTIVALRDSQAPATN